MAARLVEIYLPESECGRLQEILSRHCRKFWRVSVPGAEEHYSCLVQQRYVERLLTNLEQDFAGSPSFSAYVAELEVVIPRIEENASTVLSHDASAPRPSRIEEFFSRDRLSTDELYDDIAESIKINPGFILLVLFSAIIAGLGMRSGQTAVVIGAMVIAPLLGPTMGMAMAATLGDWKLGRSGAATLLTGSAVAVLGGVVVGSTVSIDPAVPELFNRTLVQPADIALALACGAAGFLAFTRGSSLTLVGVMIAVALVPPLTATGMFFAIGDLALSGRAFYLFAINLVCVNVAGIATLLFKGLPPHSWRITGGVLGAWIVLLGLMALMLTAIYVDELPTIGVAGQ